MRGSMRLLRIIAQGGSGSWLQSCKEARYYSPQHMVCSQSGIAHRIDESMERVWQAGIQETDSTIIYTGGFLNSVIHMKAIRSSRLLEEVPKHPRSHSGSGYAGGPGIAGTGERRFWPSETGCNRRFFKLSSGEASSSSDVVAIELPQGTRQPDGFRRVPACGIEIVRQGQPCLFLAI